MRFDGDDTERNFIALTGGEIARFCVAMLILSKTVSKVGRSDSHTGRSDSHTGRAATARSMRPSAHCENVFQ